MEEEKFDNVTPRERPRSIPIYLPVETRFIAAIARCNVRNTWSVSSISHGVELDFLKTYPIVWPRLAKSDSCLAFLFTVIQIIPSLDALVRLAIKDILNFSGSIIARFDFSMCNYLHSSCSWDFVVNLNSWNLSIQFFKLNSHFQIIQISIKFKFVPNFTLDRCEHLFTRNTSYKINKVYDVILFDKVHASTR